MPRVMAGVGAVATTTVPAPPIAMVTTPETPVAKTVGESVVPPAGKITEKIPEKLSVPAAATTTIHGPEKPVVCATEKPAEQALQKSAEKPAVAVKKPVAQAAEKLAEASAKQPMVAAEKPAVQTAEKLSVPSAEKSSVQPAEKPTVQPVQKPSVQAAAADEKVSVKVVAEEGNGLVPLEFKMKAPTLFDKMISAWCTHNLLTPKEATFEFEGRELKPDDSPHTCGWSASKGQMLIRARQVNQRKGPSFTPPDSAGQASRVAAAARVAEAKLAMQALSTVPAKRPSLEPARAQQAQSSAEGSAVDERIRVQVVAEDTGGRNVLDFRMKSNTPFERMMKAWCQHSEVPFEEASFELEDGRVLRAVDSPDTFRWTSVRGTMVVNAVPRVEGGPLSAASKGASTPAAATTWMTKKSEAQATAAAAAAAVTSAEGAQSSDQNEPAAASTTEGGAANAPIERVNVQVVTDDTTLDLRVGLRTPFEKMMKAWCQQSEVPMEEAVFEFDGQQLKQSDSPASCEWSSSKGTLVIRAVTRPDSGPAKGGVSASTEETKVAGAEVTTVASTPDVAEKFSVLVLAEDTSGWSSLDFKMNPGTPFEKMMKAWCQHNMVTLEEVRFEFHSRQLKPADTPGSCDWSPSKGTMMVRVLSRDGSSGGAAKATATADQKNEDTPSQQQSSVQEDTERARVENSVAERISIQVVAEDTKGQSVLDFKTKLTTTFAKMMKAWCEHNEVPLADACFELDGRQLQDTDTPEKCDWSLSKGVLTIKCMPREGSAREASGLGTPAGAATAALVAVLGGGAKPDRKWASLPSTSQQAAPIAAAASAGVDAINGSMDKVSVRVFAEDGKGLSALDFKMKPQTPLERMMKAWCDHNDVPFEKVGFELDGKRLKPTDTPAVYGWSTSASKTMVLQAVPVDPTDTMFFSMLKPRPSASGQPAAPHPPPDQKVSVQVVADDADGRSQVDFSMKMATPFDRMMHAWCKHNKVPIEEARFELDGKELKPNDTPASCGWSPSKGDLVIQAVPREEPGEEALAAAAAMREARVSGGVVVDYTEKISVQVVGADATGESTMDCKMKPSTPFEKMMNAWGQHNKVSLEHTTFELEGRKLKPGDTPRGFGWWASKGIMVIRALPKEEEKINVQVVAEAVHGDNKIEFAMKPSTTFERLMRAWCQHHRLSVEGASFVLDGVELKPTDTPDMHGWGAGVGDMMIRAMPRMAPQPQPKEPEVQVPSPQKPAIASQVGQAGSVAPQSQAASSITPLQISGTPQATVIPSQAEQQTPAGSSEPSKQQDAGADDAAAAAAAAAATAAAAAATAAAVALEEKIDIQVVGDGDADQATTDFRMKASTPFEKMMRAWCQHREVPLTEASFKLEQLEGRLLKPEDTPHDCGWAASMGTLIVKAVRKEKPPPPPSPVAEPQKAIVDVTPPAAPPTSKVDDQAAKENAQPPIARAKEVEVRVVAANSEANVKLKETTPFGKVMAAWCEYTGVATKDISFVAADLGRELVPTDSTGSCGWSPDRGVFTIHVKRKAQALSSAAAAVSPREALAPVSIGAPVTTGLLGIAEPEDEKVIIQVRAEDSEGVHTLTFKMKAVSPFEKVMTAWTAHHSMTISDARFVYKDRDLLPTDTPIGVGWTPSEGSELVLIAQPRNVARDDPSSDEHGGADIDSEGVVAVRVLAQGQNGHNVLNFRMKMSTPLGKMIDRWCSHHDIARENAVFLSDGVKLKYMETPDSLGWQPTKPGEELTVHAFPKSHAPAESTSKRKRPEQESREASEAKETEVGEVKDVTDVTETKEDEVKKEEEIKETKDSKDVRDVKGEQTSSKRPVTAYSLWAKVQRAGLLEAEPHLKLADQQRLLGAQWKETTNEEKRFFEEEAVKERARLEAEKTEHSRAESSRQTVSSPPPIPDPAATASSTTAAALESTPTVTAEAYKEDPAASSMVFAVVLAQGSDGPSELRFKMSQSTPFAKMISAWCGHHEIPESEATFVYNTRAISPSETPASVKHDPDGGGDLVLHAMPRNTPEAQAAIQAREKPARKLKRLSSSKGLKGRKMARLGEHSRKTTETDGDAESGEISPRPTKPKSAYYRYFDVRKESLEEERPELRDRSSEQEQIISSEWTELAEEKRRVHEQEAKEAISKYETDVAEYFERHPEAAKKKKKKKRKRRRSHDGHEFSGVEKDGGEFSDAGSGVFDIPEAPEVEEISRSRASSSDAIKPPDGRRRRKGSDTWSDNAKMKETSSGAPGKDMTFREYLKNLKEQEALKARLEQERSQQQSAASGEETASPGVTASSESCQPIRSGGGVGGGTDSPVAGSAADAAEAVAPSHQEVDSLAVRRRWKILRRFSSAVGANAVDRSPQQGEPPSTPQDARAAESTARGSEAGSSPTSSSSSTSSPPAALAPLMDPFPDAAVATEAEKKGNTPWVSSGDWAGVPSAFSGGGADPSSTEPR
eukprot:TRINITY_DN34345_c0_g1_i1.p1 TRINITY_DN34345_c0_g1~~TRINITY_DN34345_c0_g1_i1.p1  ORF type:complete len:2868 (+),score=633.37 TRINITY_DN34345_c0_g1_i1:1275-8606(+)